MTSTLSTQNNIHSKDNLTENLCEDYEHHMRIISNLNQTLTRNENLIDIVDTYTEMLDNEDDEGEKDNNGCNGTKTD